MAILARILTPSDFGLIGMALVIVGFLSVFKDAGLSTASVQQDKISNSQISMLFWINSALGVTLLLISIAIAPLVAYLFSDPRLVFIQIVMAGGFLLGGLTIQHQALLRRNMELRCLAVINVVSVTCGAAAAILCAIGGFGYWSLVIQFLVVSLVVMLLSWAATGWIPERPSRNSGVWPLVTFGGNLLAARSINYMTRNFDNLLIGAILGPAALGIYSKAYGLLMLPIRQINGPIDGVALPGLCRLQNDTEGFRRYFLRAVEALGMLGIPMVVFAMVDADRIVAIVLGPQWHEAVPIFRALGPAALVGTLNVAPGWLATALGRPEQIFRWALISAPVTVAGFAVGIQWGIFGVALSFSLTWTTMLLVFLFYTTRRSPVTMKDIGIVIWRPAVASIQGMAAVWFLKKAVAEPPMLVGFIADLVVFYVAVGLSFIVLPGGRSQLAAFINAIRPHLPVFKR